MLTNEEAWHLTNRLRAALGHELKFAQALYQLGTPADIEMLEALIGTTNHLIEGPMSDLERKTAHYMASTDQSMQRGSKSIVRAVRRVHKVTIMKHP